MILLTIASCLLFFITYFTGIYTEHLLKNFLRVNFTADFFETFLFGLMACYIYFNLLSFFIPVNYITLLPLLLISIFIFSKKNIRQDFFTRTGRLARFFFSKKNLPFIIPFMALLFVYWIIPPQNIDSGEYHYIAIRWYEQFKIVPGLANVHGRLAFNPANFIISAAYSFTDLAGQPLYPLNGVLVILFYAWLLKKILPQPNLYHFILLIPAILLFRIALINISSPSSDLLPGMLLFYCGFKTYELLKEGKTSFGDYFPVLAIACFSVTAKLSVIPSLLVIPFIYFILIKKNKQFLVALKCTLLAALIILPWLARNFLLSGYFLYPVLGTNFFHADWAVPKNVIQLDYIYSRYGPRTIIVDFFTLQKMNILHLTITWFRYMYSKYFFSLLIFILSFISPAVWLIFLLLKKKISAKPFILWCIYYTGAWIWFINSPEFRFGLSYLLLAAVLPVLELTQLLSAPRRIYQAVASVSMCICLFYYTFSAVRKDSFYFSAKDCWLKPLRDHRYFTKNDIPTFSSVNLGNGVKLYLPDNNHECLNANGPCMNWQYGQIEMRGAKIEDGFRSKKDEVKLFFPFVEAK
jgi:hypothetical protein